MGDDAPAAVLLGERKGTRTRSRGGAHERAGGGTRIPVEDDVEVRGPGAADSIAHGAADQPRALSGERRAS